ALPHHLAGRHTVLFPGSLWVRLEDGVVLMLGPFHSIGAGGVADGVRLVLFTPGVPHAVELVLVVVNDVRTHHRYFLPRLFCDENRLVTHSFPRLPILARGISDPRLASCLPCVPHLVAVAILENNWAIHIILPIGLVVGAKDDHGFAPLDTIIALNQ